MSWCRFGSPCDFTMPVGLFRVDVECAAKGCPGSDLYIFESVDGGYECCGCRLHPDDDFTAKTEDAMQAHIEDHVKAGHHVRQSLRSIDGARDVADEYKGTFWDPRSEAGPT